MDNQILTGRLIRIAFALLVAAMLAGCVVLFGRNTTYHRVDSVQQDGESNRINRTDVTVKP